MASEVDICNLALGHIGDSATVSSINPPEGSAQAEHCSRFYPIARDSLLEMHNWGFATKRTNLALLTSNFSEWKYCYAIPTDAVNLLAVLSSAATDDYSVPLQYSASVMGVPIAMGGVYEPQPYTAEALDDGTEVIYTNQDAAMLRYTSLISDTSKFRPLFVESLSWLLASYLAGPVIKGDAGAAESKRCMQAFLLAYGKATVSDANQRRTQIMQSVGWMAGR